MRFTISKVAKYLMKTKDTRKRKISLFERENVVVPQINMSFHRND